MAKLPANYVYCECGHTPCDGVDCGVYFPGQAPRKKAAPKTSSELAAIRHRAWATRRAKRENQKHDENDRFTAQEISQPRVIATCSMDGKRLGDLMREREIREGGK